MIKELVSNTKNLIGKSRLTTGNEYSVTLKYKGNSVTFRYHDNYMNKSDTDDFLYCLLSDAHAYDDSYNFADFCNEFGYDETIRRAKEIYSSCQKQSERLHKLFTDEEIECLDKEFEGF